jgi:general secretion pathway protein K
MSRSKASRQQGVALISILLIVAVAVVMAASIIQEQQSAVQSARGFISRGQAMQYALGGEELARQILAEDLIEAKETDNRSEAWASPDLHFEFEDGEVNLLITDLQGLINVNNLAGSGENRVRQWLTNLMAESGSDTAQVDRLQDWIDADSSNRPVGAEDFDYLGLDPPYRAANTMLVHASELVLTGMEPDTFSLLSANIATLPEDNSRLNVNTAPAMVIASLSPTLTIAVAESLVLTRDEQGGYETVDLFLQLPELAGLGISKDGLGVQSTFFEVRVIARYQDRFSYLTSIVQRNTVDGSMRVLQRDFSRNFRPASQVVDSRG